MAYKRTMLATDFDLEKAVYPFLALPKIDGVQGNVQDGVVLPRSLKSFGNEAFKKEFSRSELNGLNFEITLGNNPVAKNLAHDTAGALRKKEGVRDFHLWLYDIRLNGAPYVYRHTWLETVEKALPDELKKRVSVIPAQIIYEKEEYLAYREKIMGMGYEGVVIRAVDGLYKEGRSTLAEGAFLRDKAKASFEIRITGFTEAEENKNEKTTNEMGLSSRSTHKANKEAKGVIGSLIGEFVKDTELGGVMFRKGFSVKVGAGKLKKEEREHFFNNPDLIIGHIAECECLGYGIKEKPRQPVFKTFRDLIDWDME